MSDKTELTKNTTLETIGVGALAMAVGLASAGGYIPAILVGAIGVACFAIKYYWRA